jgi:hypothetical protein
MAGFNLPITQYTPAQLAEMARQAFKPPALMGGGGGGGGLGALPQSPGFNLGQGMAGAGQGLGALAGQFGKGPDINARTRASDAEIAQWSNMASPSDYAALNRVTAGPSIDSEIAGWSNYGGARADGGPVTPGKYYTVGEQGPETFVPDVPGRIVPNGQYIKDYMPPSGGQYIKDYMPPSGGQYIKDYMPPSGGQYVKDYMPPSGGQYVKDYMPERDFFGGRVRR